MITVTFTVIITNITITITTTITIVSMDACSVRKRVGGWPPSHVNLTPAWRMKASDATRSMAATSAGCD